ncbi:MAG TPA: hypothetical protein VIZ28_11815 [Chitinophagaceae bacterium]
MKKILPFLFAIAFIIYSCGPSGKTKGSPGSGSGGSYSKSQAPLKDDNTFVLTEISDDDTYGYTEKNPVMVGGVKSSEGPKNERRFLNALLGLNGESITYVRTGSCCPFDTPNGLMGGGLLDRYEVKYSGQDKPVYIYINMYDFGVLKAPKGFTINK